MVEVELAHEEYKLFPVMALIDSGCSTSMINANYARDLGIDVSSGVRLPVGGIGNGQSEGYVHMLRMNIKDSDYVFEAPFNFVTDLPIDILLGQNTFFDHFDVLFEKHIGVFKLQMSAK